MYIMIICHWAILHYNMSFQTFAGRSDGVFWWFLALSEDQEKNCLSNSPKLSCGFKLNKCHPYQAMASDAPLRSHWTMDILVPFLHLPFRALIKECAPEKCGLALKVMKFKAWCISYQSLYSCKEHCIIVPQDRFTDISNLWIWIWIWMCTLLDRSV